MELMERNTSDVMYAPELQQVSLKGSVVHDQIILKNLKTFIKIARKIRYNV